MLPGIPIISQCHLLLSDLQLYITCFHTSFKLTQCFTWARNTTPLGIKLAMSHIVRSTWPIELTWQRFHKIKTKNKNNPVIFTFFWLVRKGQTNNFFLRTKLVMRFSLNTTTSSSPLISWFAWKNTFLRR